MRKKKNKLLKSKIGLFRERYKRKGFELIDITRLCKFDLGESGWCNDFNEPEETIYHIKACYRDEEICDFPDPNKNINEDYVVFFINEKDITGRDFIIFRKVKVKKNE